MVFQKKDLWHHYITCLEVFYENLQFRSIVRCERSDRRRATWRLSLLSTDGFVCLFPRTIESEFDMI